MNLLNVLQEDLKKKLKNVKIKIPKKEKTKKGASSKGARMNAETDLEKGKKREKSSRTKAAALVTGKKFGRRSLTIGRLRHMNIHLKQPIQTSCLYLNDCLRAAWLFVGFFIEKVCFLLNLNLTVFQ